MTLDNKRADMHNTEMGRLLDAIIEKLNSDKRSLHELESLTGVNYSTIHRIKNRTRKPNIEIAEKLAEFYGLFD